MVNGWFPHVNNRGDVISGNAGIWLNGTQVSPFGIGGLWLTDDIYMFSDGNGKTIYFSDGTSMSGGYNYIRTNGNGMWAGNNGEVIDVYQGLNKVRSIVGSVPVFYGDTLYWIVNGQTTAKMLFHEGALAFGPAPIMSYTVGPVVVETYPHVINGSPNVKSDEGGVLCDKDWLLTNVGIGLALRPVGSVEGYFLEGENWYFPDFKLVGDTLIVAASASNGSPNIAHIKLTDPRIDLQKKFNAAPPVSVPTLPRKIWVGPFFSFSQRYGDTPLPEFTGNIATLVAGDPANPQASLKAELDRVRAMGLPMIVQGGVSVEPINNNQTIAWWVSGTDMTNLGKFVTDSLAQVEKPVIAYLDNRNWPTAKPAWVTGRVWPSVQAYRGPGESLDAFAANMKQVLQTVAAYGQPFVLTPRFDDFNGSMQISQILECMPLYSEWLRNFFIVGFMPFSDRRGNGIAVVPELKAWANAFNTANPARPNRFDYWIPSGDLAAALRNKLQQTTETIVLLPAEKTYLLNLINKG